MSVTIADVRRWHRDGVRFAMVTAYDYTMARILARAEIPLLLVGDSLGMVMLGHATTLPVTMDDMLHHARAVARAAPECLLIGDMPFNSYHGSVDRAVENAGRFLQVGMHAVKMEGGGPVVDLTRAMVTRGIPVMGHLGLTPQFVNAFGGFRVQGRDAKVADRIRTEALALQDAGAFALVLEGVPRTLASEVTASLEIPTIGIGAGPDCGGQVLVVTDLLGMTDGRVPTFVRQYAELGDAAVSAARSFAADVRAGRFPQDGHSYH